MRPQTAGMAGLPTLREVETGCAASINILQDGDARNLRKGTLAHPPDQQEGWHMSTSWCLRLFTVMSCLKLCGQAHLCKHGKAAIEQNSTSKKGQLTL